MSVTMVCLNLTPFSLLNTYFHFYCHIPSNTLFYSFFFFFYTIEHTPGTFTNSSGKYNVDYAAYIARYGAVPANGNGPLWYSYDFGSVHYTYIDSEESQDAGSPQLTWLQADLAAVDRSKTPWVLVFQHRPLLCSTQGEEGDHIPGGKFLTLLEPTLLANKVDLVVTGHEHVSFFLLLKVYSQ